MALTGTDRGSGTHNTAATSFGFAPGSNLAAGALAVLVLAVDNAGSGGSAMASFTVTDTKGNTWTRRQSPINDPGVANQGTEGAIFTTPQDGGALATGDTITVSFGSDTPTAKTWVLMEVTAAAGNTVTYVTGGTGTSGTGTTSPTITTGTIADAHMVIAALMIEAGTAMVITQDGDSTNGAWSTQQNAQIGSGAAGQCVASQRKVVTATATQTYNPTLSASPFDLALAWVELREDKSGTGTISASATLSSSGITGRSGAGSVSASATLTASGTAGAAGTGTITASATLTASGVAGRRGTGTISGSATLTASGVAEETESFAAVVFLDFYDEDAPDTLLGSLTDADLETYEHRPALFDLGALVFRVPKATAAANSTLLRKTNLVRTRYPMAGDDAHTWVGVLKDYRTVVVSAKEGGGEYVEWTATGAIFMLSYGQLGTTPYAPGQPALGSLTEVPARDWVWLNEPPGAVLTRICEEGQNMPGAPLGDIVLDFNRVTDSAGNPWATVIGEFRASIGSNILDVAAQLATAGDLFLVMDPDLTLHAYQSYDDFGTDRTGGAFGAGVVRWQDGAAGNILTELSRASTAIPATHMHQRDSDGNTSTETYAGYSSGRGHYIFGEAATNDDGTLNRIAQRAMDSTRADDERIAFEVIPGDDESAGEYFPTPAGLGGHWYNGDLVTVDTGSDDYDLEDASLRVVAHRIVLDRASKSTSAVHAYRSVHVVPELAYRPVVNYSTMRSPVLGTSGATPGCTCWRFCQPGLVTASAFRWYPESPSTGFAPSASGIWETDDAGSANDQGAPDAPAGTTSTFSVTSTAGTGGNDVRLLQVVIGPLSADEAAVLAAGGASIHAQFRCRSRSGIGITEANQHNISQMTARVVESDGSTVRGTAYAGHSLADSTGSTEWLPATAGQNASFPPAAASDVLSAVPGTIAGDYLAVEFGYRSFSSGVTGATLFVNDVSGGDFPEDDFTTGNVYNSWVEIRTSSITEGQLAELLGTAECMAHGDHRHVVFRDTTPTADDDDVAGFRIGTWWAEVDDPDTPSSPLVSLWVLQDDATGAAVWLEIPVPTSGGSFTHSYLGYDTIGGTQEQTVAFKYYLKKISLPAGAMIQSIDAYVVGRSNGVTPSVCAQVLEDNAGAPRQMWAVTGPVTVNPDAANDGSAGAARWLRLPIHYFNDTGASQDVWIGWQVSANSFNVYKDGSGGDRVFTSTFMGGEDAGFRTVTTTTDRYSIRASVIA